MINQATLETTKTIWAHAAQENSIRAPFYDWKWHNSWYQTEGKKTQPFLLIFDDSIIAPFVRTGNTVAFSGGEEIADYLDIIGNDNDKPHAWEEILPFLKNQGISAIALHNVPENSPTVKYFQSLQAHVEKEDTTPILTLPSAWDAYKESLDRKYRHELERKIRKMERDHPDAQTIESTDPQSDIRILFDLMEKDPAKKEFLTSEMKSFFSDISRTFSTDISLLFITLGDKKIAATYSFIYDKTYYLYNSGFDKECCANAGFYLKAETIKRAIEKKAVNYNFLQGGERYKYELGAGDFAVYHITHNLL